MHLVRTTTSIASCYLLRELEVNGLDGLDGPHITFDTEWLNMGDEMNSVLVKAYLAFDATTDPAVPAWRFMIDFQMARDGGHLYDLGTTAVFAELSRLCVH